MPTILIVEDEAKMRRLLELNLGEDGFDTRLRRRRRSRRRDAPARSRRPRYHRSQVARHGRPRISPRRKAHECSAAGDCDDRLRHRRNRGRSHESRRQRLRAEAFLARRNAHGGAQRARRPPPARREPLAPRRTRQALRVSEHRGPQPENAGSARHWSSASRQRIPRSWSAAKAASEKI